MDAARTWNVAMLTGAFPVVSETFILRQIIELLRSGQEVSIFADYEVTGSTPRHPELNQYRILDRTTYMRVPPEVAPDELPVWPLLGRTWPPGAERPVFNWVRWIRAFPVLARCMVRHPKLTRRVLSGSRYGFQAASLSALYRLDRLARARVRPTVIHAHFGPVANSYRFARELWRAPLVVTFHGYDFCRVPRERGSGVYRRLFARADAVTVNSGYTGRQVEALGCPNDRIHLLPMGVDLESIPFVERHLAPGEPVRIVTVARLVPVKGHAWALEAMARLRDRFENFQYDLVGDGPERARLEQRVKDLGLGGHVRLHGACDSAAFRTWLAESHLLLLPSITVEGDREGQGLVVQEAQASGLPVVVTDHGGLTEGMSPEASGCVVKEGDVSGLAQCMLELATHPERWAGMGQTGRRLVEHRFDARTLNDRLLEIYEAAKNRYDGSVGNG